MRFDAKRDEMNPAARGRPGEKQELKAVGRAVERVDGLDKVTGAARYAGDFKFPRMLHGVTVRSPHPHARVLNVRLDRAMHVPGPE